MLKSEKDGKKSIFSIFCLIGRHLVNVLHLRGELSYSPADPLFSRAILNLKKYADEKVFVIQKNIIMYITSQ